MVRFVCPEEFLIEASTHPDFEIQYLGNRVEEIYWDDNDDTLVIVTPREDFVIPNGYIDISAFVVNIIKNKNFETFKQFVKHYKHMKRDPEHVIYVESTKNGDYEFHHSVDDIENLEVQIEPLKHFFRYIIPIDLTDKRKLSKYMRHIQKNI